MGFKTTRWSVVVSAQRPDEDKARAAMNELCEAYWFPLYSFVRERGYRKEEAQDLTQAFFCGFLEHGWVRRADKERGKFRTFLLTCMKNFLANEWDKTQAQKRGGGQVKLSLDFERGENLFSELAVDESSPEVVYDRRWAQTLFARSLAHLEQEYTASGREQIFSALKDSITSDSDSASHKEIASQLGMSEGAVNVALHRLRKRFGEQLRNEVAQTLADQSLADAEVKYLISLF